MKVGFDISAAGATSPGIRRYIEELRTALHAGAPGLVVDLSHRRGDAGPAVPGRRAWTHVALPAWLPRSGLDLVHFPGHDAPLVGATPTVVTIHDLSWLTHPELHPRRRLARYRLVIGPIARRAAAVVVPSRATAAEVHARLGVDGDRIHVTALAPSAAFRPIDAIAARAVAARLGSPDGALLFVGTIEPRKNVAGVLDALALLRRDGLDAHLVVVGEPGWTVSLPDEIARRGLEGAVTWLRGVTDDDLAALMSVASVLVAASIDEGFGLPVVEAMAAGLPVVTAASGASAEVAGDAALTVDPRDPGVIAEAVRAVLDRPSLRADLRVRGLARAASYSWARTAHQTLAVYHSVVDRAGGTGR